MRSLAEIQNVCIFALRRNTNINNLYTMNRFLRRIIVVAFIFICGSVQLCAETLRGVVRDAITGEPLVGATIKVVELGTGSVADIDGNYLINISQGGRYTIEVSYVGYESSVMKEIMISGAREVVLNVDLRESASELKEVVVKPRVNKEATVNPNVLAGGVMLSMEEATRFAGGYNDPARLVTAFAGVSGGADSNGISVHGNAPQMLKYRIEGVEVFTPNHFNDIYEANFGMVSALNANVVGNSDFFTSTFNANYSNSLSGVFDVKMRNGNNTKYENILQIGTVSEEFTSEGPLSKKNNSSYIFNYRYAFTSLADNLGLLGDQETVYNFQDFSLKLNFPTKKAGTFSLFALGYYDKSSDKIQDIEDIETIYDALSGDCHMFGVLGGVSHKIYFGNKWTWRTTLAYNAQHIKADDNYWGLNRDANNVIITEPKISFEEPRQLYPFGRTKMNEDRILFNTEVSKQLTNKWLTQLGVEYSQRFFKMQYRSTEAIYEPVENMHTWLDAKGDTGLGSIFWQNIVKPTNNLTFNIGVASSYFTFSDDATIEPRVSMKWDFSEKNSVSLGYGLHSMIERLDAYFYEEDGQRLNKNLGFSKAHHFLGTFMHKFNENLNLRFNAFYQYGFDTPVGYTVMPNGEISTFSSVNRLFKNFDEAMVNEGNTRNYGADITLEHYMYHGFFGQINGSLYKAEYKAIDKKWRPQIYDRGFAVKLLAGKEWMLGKRKQNVLNVSAKYTLQGGLRYTPIDIEFMKAEMAAGRSYDDPIYKQDEAMSKRYHPDNIVDLTISYKINKKKVSHTIAFEGLNVLMSEPAAYERFDITTQTSKSMKAGISLPNIFYRLDF